MAFAVSLFRLRSALRGLSLIHIFVVGGGEGCNIEDSHAVGGSVTANGRATMSIGGFAGCAQESGYVKNCSVSDVTVTVNDATCLLYTSRCV